MDVSELISKFDLHGFADTPTQDKVDFINEYIWELTEAEPWPFLEKMIALTFDGNTGVATNWPADFRATISIEDLTTGIKLEPIDRDKFYASQSQGLTTKGNPYLYFFKGYQASVWPIPSSSAASNNLELFYLAHQTELTSTSLEADILIPPQFHSIIWNGVLATLYDLEDDPDQALKFEQRADKKINRMRQSVWTRQFDRPNFIELDPRDGNYYR